MNTKFVKVIQKIKVNSVKIVVILLLLVFSSVYPQVEKKEEVKKSTEKFDPARNPSEDLEKAIKIAKKSHKRIILDVGGEWCIWCHRLDKLFEDNADLNTFLIDNFEVVKVNYSPENKNENFLSKYPKVAGYPHLFVLEKNGKLLHSQNTGDLEKDKGHDPEKVMTFLKKWAPLKN